MRLRASAEPRLVEMDAKPRVASNQNARLLLKSCPDILHLAIKAGCRRLPVLNTCPVRLTDIVDDFSAVSRFDRRLDMCRIRAPIKPGCTEVPLGKFDVKSDPSHRVLVARGLCSSVGL